jgi:hypothetical protein
MRFLKFTVFFGKLWSAVMSSFGLAVFPERSSCNRLGEVSWEITLEPLWPSSPVR